MADDGSGADEEAGDDVQEEKTPEIIDDDDCPVPFNSAQYEVPDVTMYAAQASHRSPRP